MIELIETITERNFPDTFHGTYEWKGGMNTLRNRFEELTPDRTLWSSTCEYSFKSPMLRVLGFIAPGMFKKQNLGFLQAFKAFAEEGTDVNAHS